MSCIFPAISDDDVDDIINGTLELRYSLVAASVPALDNLHLMSQFAFKFVNNPLICKFNETVSYEPGSGMPLIIYVSALLCLCCYNIIISCTLLLCM